MSAQCSLLTGFAVVVDEKTAEVFLDGGFKLGDSPAVILEEEEEEE